MVFFRPDIILKKLYWILTFDVWFLSSALDPDKNITVFFAGQSCELDKRYFCRLIFKENPHENYMGKVWVWRLAYYLWRFRKDHDLIIIKTRMEICNLFRSKKKRFVIPDWVSCEIDLCSDLKSQTISKKAFTTYLRTIKKGNFHYSITKEPEDFHFFYNKMYLPYLSNRHGNMGLEVSLERMQKTFKDGELLWIKDGQEVIAGALIDYTVMNGIPRMPQIGILRGDFNYVKKGALTAIYYYIIEYLRKKDHKKLSIGLARPFIYDSLTKHKLYWGANIVCETSKAFLLCILSQKKYLKMFLSNNPFIYKEKGRLNLATFTNGNSKEDKKFAKYRKKLN